MMKIVSTFIPDITLQQKVTADFPEHEFHFVRGIKAAEALLQETEILITYGEDLNKVWIEKAPSLKWVCVMSAGMERLPFEELEKRNILVTNARGIHAIPMAEYTLGMMLSYVKCFPAMAANQQKQIWERKQPFSELYGKTLLILGTGAIGSEIARLAQAFSMKTIGMNRSGREVEHFDELILFEQLQDTLPHADVVVSVLPSTSETKNLLQFKHFEAMKAESLFINIGRGDLISEETLIKVLEQKEIAHMILDVFPKEPLEETSPLWKFSNLTITPHISSISENYLPRAFEIFEHNFNVYNGQIGDSYINKIDLNRGY